LTRSSPSAQHPDVTETISWLAVDEIVAGRIGLPDTFVAHASAELSRDASPDFLANHQVRSYLWGQLLARGHGVEIDHEAVFVSAALHDIGLTERFKGDGCFEEVGGSVAAQFLESLGWPADRAAGVKRNIVLHVEQSVSLEAGADAHVLDIGVSCDVTGRRLEAIALDDRERILAAFPRLDLKRRLVELLQRDADAHPDCAIGLWFQELDLAGRIASAAFAE
jgi:hypothetical protein